MNTGSAIETERLFLLPSRTDRDSEAFLQMLRDDGDFYIFCGVSPSEKHVMGFATVYKGNIIKNLIMDCQSYTKYRPNETTGGIFVSWRRKEELPTGA